MSTIIVGAVVFGIIGLAVYSTIKSRTKSKGGCSCGCSGCALSDNCPSHNET